MGNHEWCPRCHASDFHYGTPCEQAYPELLKKAEKSRSDREKRRLAQNKAVEETIKRLRKLNIPAEVDTFVMDDVPWNKIVIRGEYLIGDRRKAMKSTDPIERKKILDAMPDDF